MKRNGYLTSQCEIDCWGTHSDVVMPGAILSCKMVTTCGFSSHNFLQKSKQIQGKSENLSSIRDQRTKKLGNKGIAKKF